MELLDPHARLLVAAERVRSLERSMGPTRRRVRERRVRRKVGLALVTLGLRLAQEPLPQVRRLRRVAA